MKVQRFYRPEDISKDLGYRSGFWDIYASTEQEEVDVGDIQHMCQVQCSGSPSGWHTYPSCCAVILCAESGRSSPPNTCSLLHITRSKPCYLARSRGMLQLFAWRRRSEEHCSAFAVLKVAYTVRCAKVLIMPRLNADRDSFVCVGSYSRKHNKVRDPPEEYAAACSSVAEAANKARGGPTPETAGKSSATFPTVPTEVSG